MAKNRLLQRLRRRLVYWGARLVQGAFLLLPFDAAIGAGGRLGRLIFLILGRERQKTIEHLRTAFSQEKKEDELRDIARRVFANAGRAIAEIALWPRWNERRLRQRVRFANPEPLLEVIRAGSGLVILTAHFGNWELLGRYGVQILGMNAGVIARELSNPHLDRLTNRYREKGGLKVFRRGEPARGFFRHLTGGGTLAILADQDIKRLEGIFIDFFGRPAHTLTGPAELIVGTRVPWFFAVLVRQSDGRTHELICEGPFPIPEGKDRAEKVRHLAEQYTQRLEAAIRRNPDQWMWMHNRWEKRPEGNVAPLANGQ